MAIAYSQNVATVTSETFENETVLINFETGVYFSLRGSGPLIWSFLKTPLSLKQILGRLVDDPNDARESVLKMLDYLTAERCIQVVQLDSEIPSSVGKVNLEPYVPPFVETFRDLRELIVVDPIHEVDEIDGWPHRPSPLKMR